MPRGNFLYACGLLAGTFALFNLFIFLQSGHTVAGQKLAHLRDARPAQILFLGNSVMESGFDAAAMRSCWPGGSAPGLLNGALGASDPVEHDLLFRYALAHHPELRSVVYGFFDFQMTDPPSGAWEDLMGTRNLGFTLETGHAADLYGLTGWERWRFLYTRFLPAAAERDAVWEHVEKLRRTLSSLGMPAERSDHFGRAADFHQLEAASGPQFNNASNRAVLGRAPLIAPVRELLSEASRSGLRIYVVAVPVTPEHFSKFYMQPAWKSYVSYLKQRLAPYSVIWVDASSWVPDKGFADPLHMNASGAAEFSRRMGIMLGTGVAP